MTIAAATLESAPEPTTALALIEKTSAIELFSNNGLDRILNKIEKEARSTLLDISTPAGRKEIASLAFKIAKSKTSLDAAGKELVSGWKEQAKKVDAERARAWDRLEALQKEIRAPLTEWENAEKERIARHEDNLKEINLGAQHTAANWQTFSVEMMSERLAEIEVYAKLDWQEFSARAASVIEKATVAIRATIENRRAYDEEQAELERLRREDAERKQREHEDRLKTEAAAQAKAEAEEKARLAAEQETARFKAEQEKAEQERIRIEREKDEAEARAKKSEEDCLAAIKKAEEERKAAAEKTERDRIEAAAQAKRDADAAAKAERGRIEEEQRAEQEATAKREADKKHRAKINSEALSALVAAGLLETEAKKAVEAIAKGQVPNVRISY